jgi:phosphoenolpyruvate phosphomutase
LRSRSQRLKHLLNSPDLTVLMEAHGALSARLVEEAGFQAIWASGLSISAALGVRDCNEASWTQILDLLEFMADATTIPILLDGDTGYGNFNNARRLVRKLEQRSIAGVCLEDKVFPKSNSFAAGRQSLADRDEFCGKIRAAKDSQRDTDFVVVARTEALIAGCGLQEAVERSAAYAESGADAILVHSRQRDPREVLAFMEHWSGETPVVVVPTTYPGTRLKSLVEVGISNVIFANQSLRTVITALQANLGKLHASLDLMSVEQDIVPMEEIFRLQDMEEFSEAQRRYLPDGFQ